VPERPVPIWIGGHAAPALRRAARLGDGWLSANSDHATLARLIGELNRYRDEYGTRGRADFEIHAIDFAAASLDDFQRLRDLGVTEVPHIPWGVQSGIRDRQGQLDAILRFGDEVIAKLR
jgi:alkanesulfonate monooxygenase SsuD/methylene tetrahydromethanopterin reductase-like flavin-dependent oxidoreductase (luciferase family)